MSVDGELNNLSESGWESRRVLVPGGNRVGVSQENRKKKKELVKIQDTRKVITKLPEYVNIKTNNASGVSVMKKSVGKRLKHNGIKSKSLSPDPVNVVKRCHWITPNSDPLYTSFHDEEWGVPVHDDNKLFELLVFSQALGELSWPTILNQRDLFRMCFDSFDIASVATFTMKKILSLRVHGNLLLSEPKLRAVIENSKQILKVQQEFGSFNNYCWGFVNHKQIKNSHRYARQVPVKTPKAEIISKDLMQRGFRCVGPTVVYSFMQVTGIVNDHLITCCRYQECVSKVKRDAEAQLNIQDTELANTCLPPVLVGE